MEMSPDLLRLYTGMKLTKTLTPVEMRALGREKPRCEIVYLSWFLFLKSPRIWSSGNPQAIYQ